MSMTPEEAHRIVVREYEDLEYDEDFTMLQRWLLVPVEQAEMTDWITARDRRNESRR